MFKIVYTLISDTSDNYYEQLIISLISLRKHMPNSEVIVLVDSATKKSFTDKRNEIWNMVTKVKEVDIPQHYSKQQRSRYLKTTVRRHITGDYLFIDTDTVICDDLSIIDKTVELGAVRDLHMTMSERESNWEYEAKISKVGFESKFNDIHFNSGVLWVRDTQKTHEFYSMWHKLWREHTDIINQDQPGFNETNRRMNGVITEISGVWNCQIKNMDKAILYLADAKIIHYFGSSAYNGLITYDLGVCGIIEKILTEEKGEVLKVLENPKTAFSNVIIRTLTPEDATLMESWHYKLISYVHKRTKFIFDFFEKIMQIAHNLRCITLFGRKKTKYK